MIDAPDSEDEPPLARRSAVALVALLTVLPIATAIVVFVVLAHSKSESTLPPLKIGSCVQVTGPDDVVTDVACPAGNGRVVSVGTSTLQCPSTAEWGVIRDFHTYCVQRTARDP